MSNESLSIELSALEYAAKCASARIELELDELVSSIESLADRIKALESAVGERTTSVDGRTSTRISMTQPYIPPESKL